MSKLSILRPLNQQWIQHPPIDSVDDTVRSCTQLLSPFLQEAAHRVFDIGHIYFDAPNALL
jgi:hypothetical protein